MLRLGTSTTIKCFSEFCVGLKMDITGKGF